LTSEEKLSFNWSMEGHDREFKRLVVAKSYAVVTAQILCEHKPIGESTNKWKFLKL
jgi:hypothetical protein